ncbi:MAG: GHKL domain-containing protein [Lachnospiraceae bacterium]|nr:GHKL domain-containing protein [Lachnospiraceae bacterium]MEE1247994.1 GHKL domain-containing protein [Lachnospiraceae bacterium]
MRKTIALSALFQGLLLLTDYIAYTINNTILLNEKGNESILGESLIIVFGKIILFLCVLLIRKQFGKKLIDVLGDAEWIRFLFFPVFTVIIIAAIIMTFPYIKDPKQANVLYIIAVGMVVMNAVVYYLINDIVEREAKLHEKELFELQVKNQMEVYHSISKNLEAQKCKSHEFKNQILCIEALLKSQKYDEACKYVNEISKSIVKEHNVIDTNHTVINSILNIKYEEAINKKIVFVFKINDLSGIKIKEEDIVVLLANLLNNAIEACEKCEEKRVVKLKFMIEDGDVILSVKNTYKQPLIYENNELKTSKADMPEEHGIGIKNIIRIIEKYHGSYVIQNDGEEFYFSILFT